MRQIRGTLIMKCPMCGAIHSVGVINMDLVDTSGNKTATGTFYLCMDTKKYFQTVSQRQVCQQNGLVTEDYYRAGQMTM